VHLLGVGGCGMSGLARLLQELGARCSGRDGVPTDLTARLEADGIPVSRDLADEPLPPDVDLVIASAAIPDGHAARADAAARGIPVLTYAEALGLAQAECTGLSIAGTHGKSTTTAMLCHVLLEAGLDPGFIVGANCPQIGGGSRCGAARIPAGPYAGRQGLLLAEACEFRRSFHCHHPVLGAILNVEEDHLDVYGSLDAIVDAFAAFARRLPAAEDGGRLLVAHDGAHRRRTTAGVTAAVRTFGFAPAADHRVQIDPGDGRVRLWDGRDEVASFRPPMHGDHNAMNAAAAAILANWLGVAWADAARSLEGFTGLDRRMSRLGDRMLPGGAGGAGTVTVYDDYGHHPTEIDATLRALRAAESPRRLICVFQPHQHSRTRFLLEEFAAAFSHADVVIVPPIYFVRDSAAERARVSSADLVDRLRDRGVAAMHLHPFAAIVEQLEIIARPGDLVVVMGAGPVWTIARDFMDGAPPPPPPPAASADEVLLAAPSAADAAGALDGC
jgi:UDP-N-acetylmuramate--alanine ligase